MSDRNSRTPICSTGSLAKAPSFLSGRLGTPGAGSPSRRPAGSTRLLGLGDRLRLGGRGRLGLVVALEPPHLVDELADVLELPVHRCKADVGHGVELLEVLHHDLAELFAGDRSEERR